MVVMGKRNHKDVKFLSDFLKKHSMQCKMFNLPNVKFLISAVFAHI